MRYLPHTDADRRAMLAAIGASSVDALYRDVPEKARLKVPLEGATTFTDVLLGDITVENSDINPDPVLTDTHVSNNASGANNMYVSKFDPSGAFVWARTWGPTVAGGEAYGITVDQSDNLYVVGDFSSTTTSATLTVGL